MARLPARAGSAFARQAQLRAPLARHHANMAAAGARPGDPQKPAVMPSEGLSVNPVDGNKNWAFTLAIAAKCLPKP